MPDLKSELLKVQSLKDLTFDDDNQPTTIAVAEEKPTQRQVMWEYIRDNPGVNANQIAEHLGTVGPTTASALQKMFIRGIVDRYIVDGVYHYGTTLPEYPPRSFTGRKRKKKHTTKPVDVPVQSAPVSPPKANSSILDTISVREARALYEELKQLFG